MPSQPQTPETVDILKALREDHFRINNASTELVRCTRKLEGGFDHETGEVVIGVRTKYQQAFDEALIDFEEKCLREDRRLPAQDIRTARVTRAVRQQHEELYAEFLALDAQVSMLQRTISNRKAAIGAAQSILKGEKE